MQALTPILINMLFPRTDNAQTQNQSNGQNNGQANQAEGQMDDIHGAGASHPNTHRRRLQQQARRRPHSMGGSAPSFHFSQSPMSEEGLDEKQGHAVANKGKRFSLDDRPFASYDHISEKPRQQDRVMTSSMTDVTATPQLSSSNHLRRRSSADKSKESEQLLIDLA
ncbi:hypothetical protein BGW41_005111 [Actinomortierella wolfii]|nr:hypothetical protein BGW41_005111 [Actinomortierella wolfii]